MKDRSKRLAAVVDIRKTGIFRRSMVADSLHEFLCKEDCSEFVLSTLLRMGKVDVKSDCEPVIKYWIQQRALEQEVARLHNDQHRAHEGSEDLRDSDMASSSGTEQRCSSMASRVDDFLAMAEQRCTVSLLERKEEEGGKGMRYSASSRDPSTGSRAGAALPVQNPLLGGRAAGSSAGGDRALSSDGL